MTFSGKSYESIIEIEKYYIIEKARLSAYQVRLNTLRLTKSNKAEIEEIAIKIKILTNEVEEIRKIVDNLIDKIEIVDREMNNVESRIFILKFIKNYNDDDIKKKLKIEDDELDKNYISLCKKLESSVYGKYILEALKKEE